jgi:hypothetical protein
LASIVIVVRFTKKILTGNVFFRKTILEALEAKWSEVFVLNTFAPKRTNRKRVFQKIDFEGIGGKMERSFCAK